MKKILMYFCTITVLLLGSGVNQVLLAEDVENYNFSTEKNNESNLSDEEFVAQENLRKEQQPRFRDSFIDEMSPEENEEFQREIQKNKEEIDREEYLKDQQVGDLLSKILNTNEYIGLAESDEKEDKIKIMNLISDGIDEFSIDLNQKQELHMYVLKYGAYSDNIKLEQYVEDKGNIDYVASMRRNIYNGAYRHNWAAGFALENAEGASGKYSYQYNYEAPYPNLQDMGGDCTNFVSISLSNGGLAEHGNWYLKYKLVKGETRVFRPSNSTEFNKWYTASNPSPWISAPEFEKKFSGRFPNAKVNAKTYYDDIQMRSVFFKRSVFVIGDVIQVLEPHLWYKRAYHTMMITGYDYNENSFKVTYHTSDRKNVSLQTFFLKNWNEGNLDSTEIKFYHIYEGQGW